MQYVRLKNSGLKVSKIILGCMSYGSPEWQEPMPWVLGEQAGIEHIKFAYENGINTFDTANAYSNGHSEIALGKAIKALNLPRENIVVLTKVYTPVADTPGENVIDIVDPNPARFANKWGLRRKHIFASIKYILSRLQLDYVYTLQCHRFDYNTPIEETMYALHDVVQAGYFRYIRTRSCNAYQFWIIRLSFLCSTILPLPMDYAITNKLTPFISMQNHYNLIYRKGEREMFPTLKVCPHSHLCIPSLQLVQEIASKKDVSMTQIALAWVIAEEGVTTPIGGTTSVEKLEDLLGAVSVTLDAEEIKALEVPYVAQALVGHT
ncbi:Aldo/keto reductase, partial [Flagelloscypha sp. PMI_526]